MPFLNSRASNPTVKISIFTTVEQVRGFVLVLLILILERFNKNCRGCQNVTNTFFMHSSIIFEGIVSALRTLLTFDTSFPYRKYRLYFHSEIFKYVRK